ncbi:MAG: hypothetical protein KQ78_01955 [Candidatus Izimaplasma bacterium HR2]|nr:MAG: hypothetical protein KQ78_01955 [Candidatus Izimaplasma bacterium HR2]
MSRSFKKEPWVVDKKNKFEKRKANKRVRNTNIVANGRSFRKVSCSYDISDYKWRLDKEEQTYKNMNK